MRIWMLKNLMDETRNLKYDYFVYDQKYLPDIEDFFDGRSMKNIWHPIKVRTKKRNGKCDYPYLSPSFPIFSSGAIESLKYLIQDQVEILPLTSRGKDYFVLNITNYNDALNLEKSEIIRFDDGSIIGCNKFVLSKNLIKENDHIFKSGQFTTIYVSDEFKNRVINTGLKGFDFIEVEIV